MQKQTLPLSPDQLLLRVCLTVSAVFSFSALFMQLHEFVMHDLSLLLDHVDPLMRYVDFFLFATFNP